MKRVISVVLNNFKNDSRVLKEGLSLKRAGYDVKVVALHDGQSDLKEFDDVSGLAVHRIKLFSKNWSKNIFVQAVKYLEFLIRAMFECLDADILHCNDLTALPVGVLCKILSLGRIKIVYDAHEYETEQEANPNPIMHAASVMLERVCLYFVDKMFTVSAGIADEYVKRYRIKHPALVLNAPPLNKVKKTNLLREELGINNDKKIFLYQGGLSSGRGIETMIEAFETLNVANAVLVLMGDGELETWINKRISSNANIYHRRAVDAQVLLEYTSSADFGCIFYENNCLNNYYCMPNKLFEYTSAGLAVIVSNLYELSKTVTRGCFGIVAKDDSKESIIVSMREILAVNIHEYQKNAMNFAMTQCWEEQEKVLLSEYKCLK